MRIYITFDQYFIIYRVTLSQLIFTFFIINLLNKGFGDAQRLSRQGAASGNEVDDIGPLDIGTIAQAGERCVEKVMLYNSILNAMLQILILKCDK